MKLMDSMNYRYNNPEVELNIDENIVRAFLSREREKNVVEQFSLWVSMSKENLNNKLVTVISDNKKVIELSPDKVNGIRKAA